MSDPNGDDGGNDQVGSDVQPASASLAVRERAGRLKHAVSLAGGARPVAGRAGMPVPTLNNYLGGRDMKASALVDLAQACGVAVEWLATGRGGMLSQSQMQVMGILTHEVAPNGSDLVETKEFRQFLDTTPEMRPQTHAELPQPRKPSPIDCESLQLALDMLKAADGDAVLLSENAATKIIAVYNVLMGAKQ